METPTSPIARVTVPEYAAIIGKTERTVRNWLTAGELPNAEQDGRGKWWIPADAVRQTSTLATLPGHGGVTRHAPRPGQEIEHAPILCTLDQAAYLLECTPGEVASMRRNGELHGIRLNGRWRITRASIRALA